jgi:hypothetical protein
MSATVPKSSLVTKFETPGPSGFEFDVKPIVNESTVSLPCIRLRGSILYDGRVSFTACEHKSPEPATFVLESAVLSASTHTGAVDLYPLLGYPRDYSRDTWSCIIEKMENIRRCLRNGIQGYTKINDIIEILVKPDEYGRINDFRIPLDRITTAPLAKKRKTLA